MEWCKTPRCAVNGMNSYIFNNINFLDNCMYMFYFVIWTCFRKYILKMNAQNMQVQSTWLFVCFWEGWWNFRR